MPRFAVGTRAPRAGTSVDFNCSTCPLTAGEPLGTAAEVYSASETIVAFRDGYLRGELDRIERVDRGDSASRASDRAAVAFDSQLSSDFSGDGRAPVDEQQPQRI